MARLPLPGDVNQSTENWWLQVTSEVYPVIFKTACPASQNHI